MFHSLLYCLFMEQSPDGQVLQEEQGLSDRATSLGLSKCPCRCASPLVSLLRLAPAVIPSYRAPDGPAWPPTFSSWPSAAWPFLLLVPFNFPGGTLGFRRAWPQACGSQLPVGQVAGEGWHVSHDSGPSQGEHQCGSHSPLFALHKQELLKMGTSHPTPGFSGH